MTKAAPAPMQGRFVGFFKQPELPSSGGRFVYPPSGGAWGPRLLWFFEPIFAYPSSWSSHAPAIVSQSTNRASNGSSGCSNCRAFRRSRGAHSLGLLDLAARVLVPGRVFSRRNKDSHSTHCRGSLTPHPP